MIDTIKWAERKFEFDFPVALAAELLERLRGTPARLADRVRSLPAEILRLRDGDKWSIQEHAGHLTDVEQLFLGRLDDYDADLIELRPADMTGRRTFDADHNRKDINEVLAGFATERGKLVERLGMLDEVGFARTAHHPRLKTPMRVCDMMMFEATHDDYHMVKITELMRRLGTH